MKGDSYWQRVNGIQNPLTSETRAIMTFKRKDKYLKRKKVYRLQKGSEIGLKQMAPVVTEREIEWLPSVLRFL